MRRTLFQKYFLVLFAAAIFPMAAGGISNTWFSYVDQRAILSALLRPEATSAADEIESYLEGIKIPLGSTIPEDVSANASVKQLRLLVLRAMHQVPGTASVLSTVLARSGCTSLALAQTGRKAGRIARAIPLSSAPGRRRSGMAQSFIARVPNRR